MTLSISWGILDFTDEMVYILPHGEYVVTLFKIFKLCNAMYTIRYNKI
jgi:hypothetical protein